MLLPDSADFDGREDLGKNSSPTAYHGRLRNTLLSAPGRRVSARDVVPPTSACDFSRAYGCVGVPGS